MDRGHVGKVGPSLMHRGLLGRVLFNLEERSHLECTGAILVQPPSAIFYMMSIFDVFLVV